MLIKAKERKKRKIWKVNRKHVLRGIAGVGEGKRKGSKEDIRRGATKKTKSVRVIEGKEIRTDVPIEYFLSTRV